MKNSLAIYRKDGSVQIFHYEKSMLTVGRAPDNDIVLIDPKRSVSRWHAAFTAVEDGSIYVEDLRSSNGTFVNGRPVQERLRIVPQDTVALGQFKIRLCRDATEGSEFSIQEGPQGLDELQQHSQLFTAASDGLSTAGDFRHVELIYEVGVTLARSRSIAEVTTSAVQLLFKIEQVHRAAVILWDSKKEVFANLDLHMRNMGEAHAHSTACDPTKLVMSRTILKRVREQNRPLLIRDLKAESILVDAYSLVKADIQAAFCSPLTFQGDFLGILYADNLTQTDAFSESDFRTFASIAAQTGLALASAIANRELLEREVERTALRRYLPAQVADLIVEPGRGARLDGALQSVTVLYADIRGFTSISEQMNPHDVVALLRDFFSVMSSPIFECNGTLDKFIGDCIMALFGAPIESQFAVRDAVKAAILMQQSMEDFNRARSRHNALPINIGIGLHCGPAVVGNIGSSDRVQYTAIGDTVNVASRLVSKADAFQIVVSEDIRNAIPDYANFERLGEVELKGRTGKLDIFSLQWTNQTLS